MMDTEGLWKATELHRKPRPPRPRPVFLSNLTSHCLPLAHSYCYLFPTEAKPTPPSEPTPPIPGPVLGP